MLVVMETVNRCRQADGVVVSGTFWAVRNDTIPHTLITYVAICGDVGVTQRSLQRIHLATANTGTRPGSQPKHQVTQ